jgi:tetratricopeptide (TPR) repeat protein
VGADTRRASRLALEKHRQTQSYEVFGHGISLIGSLKLFRRSHMIRPIMMATMAVKAKSAAVGAGVGSVIVNQNVWDVCSRAHDVDASIAACTQILQTADEPSSNRAIAYYARAGAFKTKGYNNDAIADYTKAIDIDPRYADAYVGRGIVYQLNGDSDHAIADYTHAIEINPRHAVAYFNRGGVLENEGDHDHAIEDFTKTIDLNPQDAEAHVHRGIIFDKKGDSDHAMADFADAIKINPRHSESRSGKFGFMTNGLQQGA